MIDADMARYHERLSSRAPPPPPGSPPFRAAPRPPTPLAPRAAPLASGALLCRAEASEAEDAEAIETFHAASDRRDSGGRGLIDTEDVKEVLRDLGVVRDVGWLLDQFDVRRSTMHPYNQVLQLVKYVMSSAPSSATGQPYSPTGHGHGLRFSAAGKKKGKV